MKKLSAEEFEQMPIKGTGRSSQFYRAIINLCVGESLFIIKEEWKGYATPTRICRYIMKKFPYVKYLSGKLADGSGWAIKRVE
ncbi:MAG: hypothetical protein V1781_07290 [Bacteroidota bacterium]